MSSLADFSDITQPDRSLAEWTWLKVGGPAEYFVEPRSVEELAAVVRCCAETGVPCRVLGSGSNLLVRDEGVSGVVLRLTEESFGEITIEGTVVKVGAGVLLSHAISHSVRGGLVGLETLVGIPGTVGGALRGNAGGRSGDVGQNVQSVTVMTGSGEQFTRSEDELSFGYRHSSINELVVIDVTFALAEGDVDETLKRMRKLWIMRKATQPMAHQSAGCIFKNPRGISAGSLVEQAGLKGEKVGGAEVSDRHANFIVTSAEATAADVLALIERIRERVSEQCAVDLELEIGIW
ncbi:MAG TPA: UDP-N-acetylenolpyruvoylglucosamine reductase [Planctomycetaceae bacterium]|nr:UDP-N-acetylenolpyruvoylglucosamine reductase [Planctomycetaceae bacterium]HCD00225.1 UDP-N-acetylenolpyruvoylglucosamine reductase [Planctomycetaceae bacterium]|tara:strand:- start:389 stop:1267 length:879 start_codon:yes stop_codon:yes gene_type:complete